MENKTLEKRLVLILTGLGLLTMVNCASSTKFYRRNMDDSCYRVVDVKNYYGYGDVPRDMVILEKRSDCRDGDEPRRKIIFYE